MRLIGAREFLSTVKAGTFFLQYWTNIKYCRELIALWKQGRKDEVLSSEVCELYIFGDNGGSLELDADEDWSDTPYTIGGKDYRCLCYTDLNIVGDACPYETLYLVFDSLYEVPNSVIPKNLTKKELSRIRKWFLTTCGPFRDEIHNRLDWVQESLEEQWTDSISNYGYTGNKVKEEK